MARKLKQKDLPGMENRRIEPLHAKAVEYDGIKQQRMELTKQEADLKKEIVALISANEILRERGYHCEGVDIDYDPGIAEPKPDIKVRIAIDPEATESAEEQPVDVQDGANFPTDQVQ